MYIAVSIVNQRQSYRDLSKSFKYAIRKANLQIVCLRIGFLCAILMVLFEPQRRLLLDFMLHYINEILSNTVFMASVVAWAVAQVLKVIIELILTKKLDITRMFGEGGLPSGHSATVTAMVLTSANQFGLASFQFAVTAIVAIIVMHDAMGVRLETGKQARVLNELVRFFENSDHEYPYLSGRRLKELVGHTPIQVFAGFCLGCIVSIFFW